MPEKSKKNKSSRYIAAETLNRLFKQQLPAKQLLDKLSLTNTLSDADRNLAMKLVFGVLRNKGSLDFLITQLSTLKLKKLHPFVHQSLAVGLYQIFFLDSIPESAAVNEAVKSCQQAKVPKRLHGFVNGVLRNSIRSKNELLEKLANETDHHLNQPEWLVKRWQQHFGSETVQEILRRNQQEPSLSLRINSLKIDKDEYISRLSENSITAIEGIAPEGIILTDFSGRINELPGYSEGLFQVQDNTAQLATLLLQPVKKNSLYLDCCAGLGGKTGHLVQLCKTVGSEVIAVEPEENRRKKFQENMARLFPDITITLHSSTVQGFANKNNLQFAGIFVDAPCSGTGVIRRQPDISWNRQPEDFRQNQKLQLEILMTAAKMVEAGGILVYATCSLEPEENDQIIDTFLAENSLFSLSSCKDILPTAAQQYIRALQTQKNIAGDVFAPIPAEHSDGFFAARLVKHAE